MRSHALKDMQRFEPRQSALAPMAALGAAIATVGLTAYFVSSRRRSTSAGPQDALTAYLRDHLSGADAAIRVVDRLSSTHVGTEDGALFQRLAQEFQADRAVVSGLLAQMGASGRSIKRAIGFASGSALGVIAGGAPGDLSLLRTLEALAIGVQGKRCMWRALQCLPALQDHGVTFVGLEAKAVRQWEAIEKRRCALAMETFTTEAPQAG